MDFVVSGKTGTMMPTMNVTIVFASSSGRARSSSSDRSTSSLMRTMTISWTSAPALGSEDRRSGRDLFGDATERVVRQGDVQFGEPAIGADVVDHRPVGLVERRVARPRRRRRSTRRPTQRSLRAPRRRALRLPVRSTPDPRSGRRPRSDIGVTEGGDVCRDRSVGRRSRAVGRGRWRSAARWSPTLRAAPIASVADAATTSRSLGSVDLAGLCIARMMVEVVGFVETNLHSGSAIGVAAVQCCW